MLCSFVKWDLWPEIHPHGRHPYQNHKPLLRYILWEMLPFSIKSSCCARRRGWEKSGEMVETNRKFLHHFHGREGISKFPSHLRGLLNWNENCVLQDFFSNSPWIFTVSMRLKFQLLWGFVQDFSLYLVNIWSYDREQCLSQPVTMNLFGSAEEQKKWANNGNDPVILEYLWFIAMLFLCEYNTTKKMLVIFNRTI